MDLGDIGKVVGGAVAGAVTTVVEAGKAVVAANVAIVTAPTQILVDAVTGKPVDVTVKRINDVVVDAVSAATVAANTPNFFVINIAKAVGGDDAANIAIAATASNIIQTSLPDILVKYLNRPDLKIEDIATLPADVLLAAALDSASQQLKAVSRPIPEMVKILMTPHFSEEALAETQFVVGKIGITLPQAINGMQTFMGNKEHAVTVPGIIVFSVEPNQTKQALHWWAHELQHIMQYRTLGVAEFAVRYIRSHQEIETEAENEAVDAFPI